MSNIYLVKGGIRPVAEIIVHKKHKRLLIDEIRKSDVFYSNETYGKNHIAIYLFIHHHLRDIINFSLGKRCNKKNVFYWINGKMFGYNESEIGRYISRAINLRKLLITKQKKSSIST